ncbi:hypothetical protein PAXINDRAFT_16114 [Paxillus involutus ATCC 200175]|uniref:Uncharacterized protein n=1 Tax=Paxillus involutus ATCC 200175 TaxID=664439 RepID=A0A0C9TSW6_PAXIN|nr:hypothetical protein PAXINDRAFT_16114 [Paxillus involutus ATCC 200175]
MNQPHRDITRCGYNAPDAPSQHPNASHTTQAPHPSGRRPTHHPDRAPMTSDAPPEAQTCRPPPGHLTCQDDDPHASQTAPPWPQTPLPEPKRVAHHLHTSASPLPPPSLA